MNDDAQIDPRWAWEPFQPTANRPWDRRLAAHLFRRAAFSATPAELSQAVEQGLTASLDQLFDTRRAEAFNRQMDRSSKYLVATGDVRRISSWWVLRMLNSPSPLLEKMTLFWHGHFATSGAKVDDAKSMLEQNQLLRRHALGSFSQLVQGVSRDVAMLTYLDSTDNRKIRPNENYARELMELFCLGAGNYTERDIKEIARCFTGWEVRKVSGSARFRFNAHQHDAGVKSFLGRSGNFGGEQAVNIVVGQPAATTFIAQKLIRFFVFDEEPIDATLAAPIAETLVKSDFDIAPALRQILSSNLFFANQAVANKIRSPIELVVGLLRQLDAQSNMGVLLDELKAMGQLPLFPPNVKGWEGGRRWLNASTLLARANFVRRIARGEASSLSDGSLSGWADRVGAPGKPAIINWLSDLLLAREPPGQVNAALREIASAPGSIDKRLANLITAIGVLPEYQLN